jgi:hypothetical protein
VGIEIVVIVVIVLETIEVIVVEGHNY